MVFFWLLVVRNFQSCRSFQLIHTFPAGISNRIGHTHTHNHAITQKLFMFTFYIIRSENKYINIVRDKKLKHHHNRTKSRCLSTCLVRLSFHYFECVFIGVTFVFQTRRPRLSSTPERWTGPNDGSTYRYLFGPKKKNEHTHTATILF